MRPLHWSDSPAMSSSQPTGWRGRRLASTAPPGSKKVGGLEGGEFGKTGSAQQLVQPDNHRQGQQGECPQAPTPAPSAIGAAGACGPRGSPARPPQAMVHPRHRHPQPCGILRQCGRPPSRERYGRRDEGARAALPTSLPALLDHPGDPTGSFGGHLDRRGVQREQARSVSSRPDRCRAPGYGPGARPCGSDQDLPELLRSC